jgi:hypothetical protein
MSRTQLLPRRHASRLLAGQRRSRAQVENILREIAFVLHATRQVRQAMPSEAPKPTCCNPWT